ncbi:type II toxin-antitoxin system CcdA family antitoxin [Phytobacter sp. V91]|uniref:type II toxin-antitoxin system CcdA family antitoxin n=1 Tax=Phytobacter sp. V91 TaxID=3369425 RepID=UPI003F5F7D21
MPGVNVRLKKTASVTLAAALKKESDDTGAEHWKRENRAGLQELNRITDEHGLLSDEYKTF